MSSYCRVHLDNYPGVYYPGNDIRGRVECYFKDSKTIRGIKIRFKGKERNEWFGTESYTDSNHKTQTRTVTFSGEHDVVSLEQVLAGSSHGSMDIATGQHSFPFQFMVPHDIPSTFSGPHGFIEYSIKSIVDVPMRTDYEDKVKINVNSPIDFNRLPRDKQDPVALSDDKTVCCWCCAGGTVTLNVELPKLAFVSDEHVPIRVTVRNMSNTNVASLQLLLTKRVTYTVTSPRHETKEETTDVNKVQEHGQGAHGEHTYDINFEIPKHIEIPNFTKCELFKVTYKMVIMCEMDGCTMDLEVPVYPELGHIPWGVSPAGFSPAPLISGPPPVGAVIPSYPGQAYPPPPGSTWQPPSPPKGAYIPPALPGGAYPPVGGAYPTAPGGAPYPQPSAGFYYPPGPAGGLPPTAPSAPGGDKGSAYPPLSNFSEIPPPSYDDAQKHSTTPYPTAPS